MRTFRKLIAIPAFVVFPVALLIAANALFVGSRLPDTVEQTMVEFLDTEEGTQMLADDLTEILLDNPELGLRRDEIVEAVPEVLESDEFRTEAAAYIDDFSAYLQGETDVAPTIDLTDTLADVRDDIDPELFDQLSEHAVMTPNSGEFAGVLDFELVRDFGTRAAIVATVSLVLLALASQSARVVLASLAFVLGPLAALQALLIQVVRNVPDEPTSAFVVTEATSDWMRLTAGLGVLALVSLVLFVLWPKPNKTAPPQLVNTTELHDAIYRGEAAA